MFLFVHSSFIVFSIIIAFKTNPNKITNCFQTYSLLFTTLQTTFAQCVRLFLIFEGSLDRLPSMPLDLNGRGRTDDFVFTSTEQPISNMRAVSLGYSKVPLQTSGMYE